MDLVEFGRIENELYDEGELSWELVNDIETVYGFKNYCVFEILELRIGLTPKDFHIEIEDLYTSEDFAADFWLWEEDTSPYLNPWDIFNRQLNSGFPSYQLWQLVLGVTTWFCSFQFVVQSSILCTVYSRTSLV